MKFLFYGLGVVLVIIGAFLATYAAMDSWDGAVGGWVAAIGVFCLFGAFYIHLDET